jgi:hypothetical protein
MLGSEWRVVRFWHSELERVDAQRLWMGKGGRTAVSDGKGWTHSSVGWERVDAQQCRMGKGGRTAVRPYNFATSQFHSFTISLITIY